MKSVFVSCLALLGAWFGVGSLAGRVIHFPVYGQHKDWQWMEVYRAEFTPDSAVFDVTLYGAPGERLRLSSGDALCGLPSGRTSRLLRAEGVPLDSLVAVPDSGLLTLRLAFEPVAPGDTAVDWLSGADGHKVYDALSLRAPSAGGGGVTCRIAGRVADTTRVSRFLLLPEGVDPRVVTPLSLPVRGGRFARTCRFPRPMRVELIAYEQLMRGAWMPARFFAENGRVDVSWRGDERADVASDGALGRQDSAMRAEHRARFKPRLEPYYDRVSRLSETEAYYTAEGKALFDTLDVVMRRYYSDAGTPRDGDRLDSLYRERDRLERERRLHSAAYYALHDSIVRINAEADAWQRQWAEDHPTLVGLYLVREQLQREGQPDSVYDALAALFERRYAAPFAAHPVTAECRDLIAGHTALRPGARYIDYTATRLDGGEERIGTLLAGRVTLVDLWASWCGPCRRNSLRLIPVYEKWRPYGFQVIGIAREHGDTRAMRQAIGRDGYPWAQFVDLDDRHGVWEKHRLARSGGGTVLVDSDGTVMAVNPTAEEVDRLLAERFGAAQ